MKKADKSQQLLADLGGTHVRFARGREGELAAMEKLVCTDFNSFSDAIRFYLDKYPLNTPCQVCFAIASPLSGDQVEMTNSPWSFSLSQLQQEFSLDQLYAINDFEAIAHAVPHLQSSQLLQFGGGNRDSRGNMAVLGPGTGLGVKHLTRCEHGWKVLMGEGGHVDFAPVDETDLLLWQSLKSSHSHVATEDLLSGRGLQYIYNALCAQHNEETRFTDSVAIINAGLNNRCEFCVKTLAQFLRILGSFAGNLALNLNTTGGVYLCGGVITALAPLLPESDFRARFEAKGRFQPYVENIPVFLVTEPEPGLMGALKFLEGQSE